MRGKNFLTDAFEDRIDTSHETINVFSVPVYEKERKTVKGVLFANCKDEMLEGCLKNEIFEGQAFNYIIKIDGTIVATSGNSKEWGIGRNIFNTDVSEDERDDYAGDLMLSNMKEKRLSARRPRSGSGNHSGLEFPRGTGRLLHALRRNARRLEILQLQRRRIFRLFPCK